MGSNLPCDMTDHELFAVASEITLGDGSIRKFWHDHWMNGEAPKEVALSLFLIVGRKIDPFGML